MSMASSTERPKTRAAASRRRGEAVFTVGSEFECRSDVVAGEFGEVGDDLIRRHPRRQVLEDVVDRDARAHKGRFPAPNARPGFDQRHQLHTCIVLIRPNQSPGIGLEEPPEEPPRRKRRKS